MNIPTSEEIITNVLGSSSKIPQSSSSNIQFSSKAISNYFHKVAIKLDLWEKICEIYF